MRGEAAHNADPLRRRRDRDLPFQHRHGVRKTAHAVPAQLHIEVETATNDMEMIIDQSGQYASCFKVDDLCSLIGERHHISIVPDGCEDSIGDCDCTGGWVRAIEGRESPISQD